MSNGEELELEKLFNSWIELKLDIQNLASIVQNPTNDISIENLDEWTQTYKNFVRKLNTLYLQTHLYILMSIVARNLQ